MIIRLPSMLIPNHDVMYDCIVNGMYCGLFNIKYIYYYFSNNKNNNNNNNNYSYV